MDKKITHHLALAETSSVVAHDLCAQLHVMKFCLEEITENTKVPKHLFDEYMSQLNSSTEYMDRLLLTYRGLLKLEKEECESFHLASVLDYAQHLAQGHYQGISSNIVFDQKYNDHEGEYAGSYLTYSHIVFALYSSFIEWEHERSERKEFHFTHTLFESKDGPPVLSLGLEGSKMTKEDFLSLVHSRTRLKGRLRQWCGLDYLSEQEKINNGFFEVSMGKHMTSIRIKLPCRLK